MFGVFLVFIITVTAVLPAQEPIQSPLFGTWRFNMAKSRLDSVPPFIRATCRIEPWRDGIRVSYDMVGTRGGVAHWEWTGRFDGKDYPLQGIDEAVTNAYTRIDERSYRIDAKMDGRLTTITEIAISSDGRTMTASNTVVHSGGQTPGTILVWEQ
jgi:hypothetical protein